MFSRLSEQDYYQVLEVDYQASSEEIQTAYESAKDIYGGESLVSISILTPEERRQVLHRINEAYNTLIAEDSRRLYDESLAGWEQGLEEEPSPLFETAEAIDKGADRSPQSFPRLVKGATPSEPPKRRSKVQLGLKEEANGDFLRRARESCGLDLRSIAEETKIGVTMLSYIEEEKLDRLPVPVYLKNFVSQYARCLGLEEEKVSRSYLARIRRLLEKPPS